jgi:hypothetical protein
MVYRNDSLGFGSPNTGFFFYFKQGTLQSVDLQFQEAIQNNLWPIDIDGINNSDTWLYELNDQDTISNQWTQVDNIYINANLQGNSSKKIFSVSSRFNDQITYLFGDGVFGEIPVGNYRAYVRSGNGQTYTISPSEMQGVVVNIDYVSRSNRIETLTMTLSLETTVNTALERESLTQIKERAPARYYTQNRMVNGEDYSNFPFTLFNSIIKSTAINRSSIGVSRNLDLTDPTYKYSSANVFADDGALYTDNTNLSLIFSTNINSVTEFLSQTLSVVLSNTATIQYYLENYPRYTGFYSSPSIDGQVYWKQLTTDNNTVTGYFYILTAPTVQLPVSAGSTVTSNTLKYVTQKAQLKFLASPDPVTGAPRYFDSNNRLQIGTPNINNGDKTYIWVAVNSVIGDGKNGGDGAFSNGTGPITLNSFVPTGAYIDSAVISGTTGYGIIPSFDNTLDSSVITTIKNQIQLLYDFSLVYDNSLATTVSRWTVSTVNDTAWFLKFQYDSINQNYVITVRNTNYYFGSVTQCRFLFENDKLIYDPKSGQTLSDFINIIRTNNNSANTATLGSDYVLYITDQPTQSDGYPNDYQVKISSISPLTGVTSSPDFFDIIVGSGSNSYVFFKVITDVNSLYSYQLLPVNSIVYAYSTQSQIIDVLYEYNSGTVFYATTEDKFYQSRQILGVSPITLTLDDVSDNYTVKIGRSSLNFQYRHNSDNTTRIDPSTTNIIDMYLVTASYYQQYQNWINDNTGTVALPSKPTIAELQQSYGNLNNYKMLSDSVILNSVTFKPLFGSKASTALQGKIKVIKSPSTTASDSQIRSSVLTALQNYFTIDKWDFGDTFYMSELTAYLHVELADYISSVVLVPNDPNQTFGDLYEIRSAPNEIFVNGASISDIIVISALTPAALQRGI